MWIRKPLEPAREVPIPGTEQLHARRHEHAANDRGVDQKRDADAEPDLLRLGEITAREAREDGDDDQRGAGDHPSRGCNGVRHGFIVVPGAQVALADPAQQEHVVVHGEAEEDREEEERDPGRHQLRLS